MNGFLNLQMRANQRFYTLVYGRKNARAIAFYKRLGFEEVGKYLYQVGKTFDDERIMRLELE